MNRNISIINIALILSLFALFTSCEKDDKDIKVTAVTVKEAVYISSGSFMQISLKDNATLQLTPFIMPQAATNKTVKYSNKNPELMTVSESGLITAKLPGTDTLIVSATDGSGVTVSYPVRITDHQVKATGINVTAAGSNITLKIGGSSFDLGACVTLSPADTWNQTVAYKSNNEAVITVSETGIVSPVEIGNTTITITTTDGSNISRDCNVTVQDIVQQWDEIDRANWTVTTQTGTGYDYVRDGWSATLGAFTTGQPEHLFDNNAGTYLSLCKPGKSFSPGNGADPVPAQPSDFLPSFTIDMKSQQTFNYIKWIHRNGNNPAGGSNNYNYLRVYGVNIYGSNDGSAFTPINTEGIVWIPNLGGYAGQMGIADPTVYTIEIPASAYRYVKVELAMWSDIYNSQNPDFPGAGATAGSSMQIGEFGLGNMYWE